MRILTLAGDKSSALRPYRFTPEERACPPPAYVTTYLTPPGLELQPPPPQLMQPVASRYDRPTGANTLFIESHI
jgi:hypothetical protein